MYEWCMYITAVALQCMKLKSPSSLNKENEGCCVDGRNKMMKGMEGQRKRKRCDVTSFFG